MQAHKTPTAKLAENYKMKGRLIFIVGDAQEYAQTWMQGLKQQEFLQPYTTIAGTRFSDRKELIKK